MRKRIILLSLLLVICALGLAFSACTEGGDDHEHSYSDWVETAAPTCTTTGSRTRICSCGDVQTESISAKGHTLTHTAAVKPTCTAAGKEEYWTCSACTKHFEDAAGKKEIADIATYGVIAATGHTLTKTDEVSATCTTAGKKAYWTCSDCKKYFEDADGKKEIADLAKYGVIAAAGHKLTKKDEAPATCTTAGKKAYWTCSACDKYYEDADGKKEIADLAKYGVIAATGHTLTKTDEVSATCTTAGKKAYWTCSDCKKHFEDADGKKEITDLATYGILAAKGHTMTHTDKVDPTCTAAGKVEYWSCSVCKKNYEDAEGKKEITDLATYGTLSAKGHTMTHTDKVEPTATTAGKQEYWTCSVCKKHFEDADGGKEIFDLAAYGVIAATGEVSVDGLAYLLKEDDTYEVTGIGTFTDTDLVIPATFNGKAVTSVAERAFRSCTQLTSISISNTVTAIGVAAFPDSENLQYNEYDNALYLGNAENPYVVLVKPTKRSITQCEIPAGTRVIYESALYNCTDLTSVTFAKGSQLTSIGVGAFYECGKIASITIPASVTEICDWAFFACESLTSMTIPSNVKTIGGYAFACCLGLTSVTINNGVTSIGECAFNCCLGLTSVTIPASVTEIGAAAFFCAMGNGSGTPIVPGALEDIFVADENEHYKSVDGVLYSKDGKTLVAYPTRKAATAFVIPSGVTAISEAAFGVCLELTSITIPASVTAIAEGAFIACAGLTEIVVDAENDAYHSAGNCLIETGSKTLIMGCKSSVIPDDGSVTRIGRGAFIYSIGRTSVELPDGVMSIGEAAFAFSGLTSITIPDSVTSIEESAFGECRNLTSVIIPEGVTEIAGNMFSSCVALTEVVIPASVTSIGYGAFWYCRGLTTIYYGGTAADRDGIEINGDNDELTSAIWYYYSETEPTVAGNYWHYADGDVTVWEVTITSDETDDNGLVYVLKSNGTYELKSIGTYASTDLVIPATFNGKAVTIVGESACAGASITSVIFSKNITFVKAYAFRGCTGLQTVYFVGAATEENIMIVGDESPLTSAIWYYYSETQPTEAGAYWHYVDGVVTVWQIELDVSDGYSKGLLCRQNGGGEYIVCGIGSCTDSDLVIPAAYNGKAVTGIAEGAFRGCTQLTSVVIPASVKYIEGDAFRNCTNLISLTLEEGSDLSWVGSGALRNCTSLTTWTIPEFKGIPDLPQDLFEGCTANTFTMYFLGDLSGWCRLGGGEIFRLRDDQSTTMIAYVDGVRLAGDVILPEGTTGIRQGAFYACSAITSIVIPSSVTSIGRYAFDGCAALTAVYYGGTEWNDLTDWIGEQTFATIYYYSETEPAVAGNYWHYVEGVATVWEVTVIPDDTDDNGLVYVLKTDDTYEVASIGTFKGTDLVIPAIFNGKAVTSIGKWAFGGCTGLTSITIPNSITTIGEYAFLYCTGLTSIEIPASVESIGEIAFAECTSLTSVTFAKGSQLTSIGERIFAYCTGLTAIEIPASVMSIGVQAFEGCTGLTSITIPDSVTSIEDSAFSGCTDLTSVTFAERSQLMSIGEDAFSDCTALTSIELPASVASIEDSAFSGCTDLTSVTFAESSQLTSIWWYVFRGCIALTSITIPNSVTSIGPFAFDGCTSLTSITIPASVTSIGWDAFDGCTVLTAVYYGGTAADRDEIEIDSNNDALTSATWYYYSEIEPADEGNYWHYVEGEIVVWGEEITPTEPTYSEGLAYTLKDDDTYKVTGIGTCTDTELVIPPTYDGKAVTSIGDDAFLNRDDLTLVTIPRSVTSIGEFAFFSCDGLTSISIPNSVTEIKRQAVSNCSNLTSVTIPDSVRMVGESAFLGCGRVETITIGSGVESIGDFALNCDDETRSSLKEIILSPENPYFKVVDGDLYTMDGSRLIQHTLSGGRTAAVVAPGTVTIGAGAFSAFADMEYIMMPESVKSIGDYAFYACPSLTAVYYFGTAEQAATIQLDEDDTEFATATWYYYSETEPTVEGNYWHYVDGEITVWEAAPAEPTYSEGLAYKLSGGTYSVTGIGTCTDTEVVIPPTYNGEAVTSIWEGAFFSLNTLTSVTIPASVTSLGWNPFAGCANLVEIIVAEGNPIYHSAGNCLIETESKTLILGCASSVIPDDGSVTKIGNSAFFACYELTSLTIPEGVEEIEFQAFCACLKLSSITIPASVTKIGYGAFACSRVGEDIVRGALSEILVAEGSEHYKSVDGVLYSKDGTTLVAYPAGKEGASFVIPEGVTEIFDFAFCACTGLESVVIPDGVTRIDTSAFESCIGLTTVVIPASVTSIEEYAFLDCPQLTTVCYRGTAADREEMEIDTLDSLTSKTWYYYSDTQPTDEGDYWHYVDGEITVWEAEVITPDEPVSIDGVLYQLKADDTYEVVGIGTCKDTEIVIPATYNGKAVTSIGESAFYDCTGLTSVTIPEGVSSIGINAFSGCTSIRSFTIPASVTTIGESAFLCAGPDANGEIVGGALTEILVAEGSEHYKSVDGVLYTKDGATLVVYPTAKRGVSFEIPAGVTTIAACAFAACADLTSVTIPASVSSIGDGVFTASMNLVEIVVADGNSVYHSAGNCLIETESRTLIVGCASSVIPDDGSVTAIGQTSFSYCNSLTAIEIPAGVTSIEDMAFLYCTALTAVTIGSDVTMIERWAFTYCTSLTTVVLSSSVTRIKSGVFEACASLTTVYYGGTETDRSDIRISENNAPLLAATWYYYSETEPTTEGNYWHYVEGEITVWEVEIIPAGSSRGLVYTLKDDDTYEVTGIVSDGITEITIQATCNGKAVTSIGAGAFSTCYLLMDVVIPVSVTVIGAGAFGEQTELSVLYCGDQMDREGIEIGEDNDALTDAIWYYYSETEPMDEGNYWHYMDGRCFVWENGGEEEWIYDDSGFRYVVYGDAYKVAGFQSEYGEEVTSVVIPATYKGKPVTVIKSEAFGWMESLTSVVIPESVIRIEKYAFRDCVSLLAIDLPASVTTIGAEAFAGCTSLTSVTISANVTTIGEGAFAGCSALDEIIVEAGNPVYHSAGNCLIETESKTLIVGCKSSVIPDDGSVTVIGEDAFRECVGLTSIVIPEGVTEIGDAAFYGCLALTSISLPASLSKLGFGALVCAVEAEDPSEIDCGSLTEILVAEGNETYMSLDGVLYSQDGKTLLLYPAGRTASSFEIPAGVTTIGMGAFGMCTHLASVTFPASVTVIGVEAFVYCTGLTSIAIPEGVTVLSEGTFIGCYGLTSITIPAWVTKIEHGVFSYCGGLTEVIFAEGNALTEIGDDAFQGCGLLSVTIPEGVTEIGIATFAHCESLASVVLHAGVTAIRMDAFRGCLRLSSIEIPASVESIGESAFFECPSLTSITIPAGVTEIGAQAFSGCEDLSEIVVAAGNPVYHSAGNCLIETASKTLILGCKDSVIPADGSVTSIGDWAFYEISGLRSIVLPVRVKSISDCAFSYDFRYVYYCGTLAQAALIEGYEESSLCWLYYSETEPEDENNGYWHYVDGEVTVWEGWIDPYDPSNYDHPIEPTDPTDPGEGPTDPDSNEGLAYTLKDDGTYEVSGVGSFDGTDLVIGSTYNGIAVTSIGAEAFLECESLQSVCIGANVTVIEMDAFSYCTNLSSVTFASGSALTAIVEGAFYGCASLTSIELPASVETIGEAAFYETALESVTYGGTESDREAIEIAADNEALTDAAWSYQA